MELHPSRRARRALSLLTTMAITAALLPLALAPGASAAAKRTNLDKRDRELLAEAKANGETHVTVLIAAVQGGTTAAANAVTAAGGTIRTRDDALGYLRALVPTDKVKQVAASSAVQTIDLDEVIPLDDPVPAGQANPTPYPAPDSSTPRVNPYMPTGDTGAAQFSLAHPQWDGRGVTIGILDTGVDLDHPSLQTTSTGERKIVDWVTFTDPFGDNDPTWVDMSAQVTGPTFSFQDQTYTAPAADQYRIGLFNERDPRLGGELGNDVNRDGNPAGSSGIFAVLQGGSTVWVDTDQDLDFNDEAAMRDYAVHHDVGHFGTDVPATPVQERLPYVVQVDLPDKVVNIGIVSGAHGTHTTGIMSANGLFGGDMAGAAPGAKVVSVRVCLFIAGCTAHALVEGMIWVVKEAHVDVVNMSIGGLPSLNDGNNTRAVIYNRLIDQYGVQMFISAGNSGPGTNTVGDPSVATEVMSVGAYITDATWESNYGSTAPAPGTDNLHPFSSRGPREDGGLKPQIVAPGAAISSTPLWQPGGPVAGVHDLPPGYSMFNGTSMAAPQATGAAALLLSAAKAGNVAADPARLRLALNSTARFLDGYGAHEQGNGLIDVGAAWNLLTQNPQPVDITSSVPVNTLLAGFLATPGTGVGIHDREGVTLGQSYTRTYTFRRNSGPGGTIAYDVEWVGNDGTFSSAATINLKKGVPATLPVSVDPSVYGAHSALLNLDNPATPGIDYQTMNVVVVPHEFSAANGYAQVFNGSVARNQALSYFVRVPAGATALKVDFTGPNATPGTGQARFLRFHPYGVPIDSNTSTVCYSPPVVPGGSCPGGGPNSRTTTNPTPGVWEVTVEARRTSDIALTPCTLTASVLSATVAPNPDVIASATIGTPVARSYTITNNLAAFTGRAVGTTLGSALRGRFTIANLEQQERTVNVTAGSTSLRATIGNPSDPGADLDLFVFNCTSGTCVLAGQSADGDSEESVTINNPAAGEWLVLVDGFSVPAGTTQYDYVDVFVNPAFGSISVTDANALRPSGSSWIVPASVTANSAPAAGRVLLGNVQVRTDVNVLVGQGDVVVENVT